MQIENFFAESKTLLPHPDISNLIKENLHICITFSPNYYKYVYSSDIPQILCNNIKNPNIKNYYSMSENRPFCNVR